MLTTSSPPIAGGPRQKTERERLLCSRQANFRKAGPSYQKKTMEACSSRERVRKKPTETTRKGERGIKGAKKGGTYLNWERSEK